jgi:uncharacterized protein YjiS (DUF1127 family)
MNHSEIKFRVLGFLTTLVMKVENWRLREKSSMEFAGIDRHILNDINISDADRFIEVNKPFWGK